MTIQQRWQYGKERGAETYSRIVSDVDVMGTSGHYLITPGAVSFNGRAYGKSIEVDRATGAVVFEATIFPPNVLSPTFAPIAMHRTERMTLYPPE